MNNFFEMELDGLGNVNAYAHRIYGYRYNWHEDWEEINIVLKGSLEFVRGGEKYLLEEDDVILVDPGIPHASYPLEADTVTFVIHFPARIFPESLRGNSMVSLRAVSDAETRGSSAFRELRYLCARLAMALAENKSAWNSRALVRGSVELLAETLYTRFSEPAATRGTVLPREEDRLSFSRITDYIVLHYAEKLKLQDIAERFGYNRTYVSTLFKKQLGIGFHDYLNRCRFQHAIVDLGAPEKSLLDVALDNGFPDLNTFNQMFLAAFGTYPRDYRERMRRELENAGLIPDLPLKRDFVDLCTGLPREKLDDYRMRS